jgi:hypothetical protein
MADESGSPNEALARKVLQAFILRGQPIVAAMFDGYRRGVMPPGAGPIQILECKRAYFAGARSMLDLVDAVTDPGLDVTSQDVAIMAAIDAELDAYMEDGKRAEHTAAAPEGRA